MTSFHTNIKDNKQSIFTNDILNSFDQIHSAQNNNNNTNHNNSAFDGNITNEWKRSPSYTNSYEDEWFRLFKSDNLSSESIRNLGLSGELRNCRFRSVCWRIYLRVLSSDSVANWVTEVRGHRQRYIDLRNRYVIDPRQPQSQSAAKLHHQQPQDDPLSLQDESKWNQYFKSQDIMKEIQQDVVRTFPEIEFFRSQSVRNSMINVLYCYSQTSRLFYRQGMHEILAPLVFVLHCDHMAFEHSLEIANLSESMLEQCSVLLDSHYLEHDAYSIFSRVMGIIESWYESTSTRPGSAAISSPCLNSLSGRKTLTPSVELRPFEKPRELMPDCSISRRLQHIHEQILRRQDLDLYLHLERLEIAPQMFGLRWLKLLFGREFTMQDLLIVWDVLFAIGCSESGELCVADHIYVSMLVHIREYLLTADFTSCLTRLMRYPANVDVNRIIDYALFLFDPNVFPRPKETGAQFPGILGVAINDYSSGTSTTPRRKQQRAQRNKTIVGIETFANRLSNLINKKSPIAANEPEQRPNQLGFYRPIRHPSVSDSAPVTPTNAPIGVSASSHLSSQQPIDVTDFLDISIIRNNDDSEWLLKIVSVCSKLVTQSIDDINSHLAGVSKTESHAKLDRAIATLRQTRDILNGNLTLNRKKLIAELQCDRPSHIKRLGSAVTSSGSPQYRGIGSSNPPGGKLLNRSVSNNDLPALRNSSESPSNTYNNDHASNTANNNNIDLSERFLRLITNNPTTNTSFSPGAHVELQGISSSRTG